MKRLFLALLLMVSVLVPVLAKDSGTRFNSISGTVRVAADEAAKANQWGFARLETVLNVDDHVKTGEESSAILSFADMSTFVMKEETEIILNSPPDKDSKINLVAGKIWANVKKMAKDGTMEIEMSQAVAGIKGTNITCESNDTENRIQVLRGMAEIFIKETQEKILVNEGEELMVKAGGKSDKKEIDVGAAQEEWKNQLESLGSNIQLNEIPEMLREMLESQTGAFNELTEDFKTLMSSTNATPEDISEFKKDAERYVGVLMEDGMILAAMRNKVENEMSSTEATPADRERLQGYLKQIGEAGGRIQEYQAQIGKWLKTNFGTGTGGASEEVGQMLADVTEIWSTVQGLIAEVSANPTGLSQDWFFSALDMVSETMHELDEQAELVQAFLEENPGNQAAANLLVQIGQYQNQIGRLLKDFNVVEIDGAVLTEMQDAEDMISEAITKLQEQIDAYNDAVHGQADVVKLEKSLGILNNFSKARRLYINSQRLHDSVMRATSGQKFKTAEQEELSDTYERITETYNQLGIVADQLQSRLSELQSQLGSQLR